MACATDVLMFLYGLISAAVTITLSCVLFSEPSAEKFTVAGVIFGASLLVLAVSVLLRLFIEWIYRKCFVGRLERIRNNLLIGFGLVSICGLVSRILVFFLEDSVETHISCFFISIISAGIVFSVFVGFNRPWSINYLPHIMLLTSISIFHLIISIIIIGIVFEDSEVGKFKVFIALMISLFFAAGFVDFLAVLLGGLGWENGVEPPIPLKAIKVVKNKEKVAPAVDLMNLSPPKASECEICTLEYSNSLIPRILTNCGHTICQICAGNFLKKNGIACPFCRTVTERIYQARSLPKNHLALDLINKIPGSEFCKSCSIGYSDLVTPRVLVECGHSVCEVCAGKLLGEGDKIKCVACKKVTKGYKEARQMPKNFVALELIEERDN